MAADERKQRVVMIDDDLDFQAVVKGWLSPRYDLSCLPDGEDILDELEGLDPDVVILDVRMPGFDGFQLCGMIRTDPRFDGLPVLFLTGCKEDEDFIKNMEAGGTAFLTKPIARGRLLSVMRELLSRWD